MCRPKASGVLLLSAILGGILINGCSREDDVGRESEQPEVLVQSRTLAGLPDSPYDPSVKSAPPATETISDTEYTVVKVYYGTDRARLSSEEIRVRMSVGRIFRSWVIAIVLLGLVLLVRRRFKSRRFPNLVRVLTMVGLLASWVVALIGTYTWLRTRLDDSLQIEIYGSNRGVLERGFCEVSIPKHHRVGMLESPSVLRLEFHEDPTRHVVLQDVLPVELDAFYSDLVQCVEGSMRQSAFVFVHGYNTGFKEAARRTAQMAYDLKFDGAPIFFSWPSQGDLLQYPVDETNVAWAVSHFKTFLLEIAWRSGAQQVHLIAHSMGNRLLTAALRELSLEQEETCPVFQDVVLTAPDIDAEVFRRDIVPAILSTAERVTLYSSSNDEALALSKRIHGYDRAGDSGERIIVLSGMDTIDVSNVDTSLLGHNYYGSNQTVLADLFDLLHEAKPPDERQWLAPAPFQDLQYWTFLQD